MLYRTKIEEKMLIEKFGDEYRDYMKKTKKLIPFVY
jgi:protein-S-isoprenylcysteine O-methyltransferase Ste14